MFLELSQVIGPNPWCDKASWVLNFSDPEPRNLETLLSVLSISPFKDDLEGFKEAKEEVEWVVKLTELLLSPLEIHSKVLGPYPKKIKGSQVFSIALTCRENSLLKDGILTSYNFIRWVYLTSRPQNELKVWSQTLSNFLVRVENFHRHNFTNSVIQEAENLGIPFFLADPYNLIYQLGVGERSHLFLNSATEEDSYLGSAVCNNKLSSYHLLTSLGAPVPKQILIESPEKIPLIRNTVGYPCVIKPINQEQGRGVTCGIADRDGAKEALIQAQRFGARNVIVQEQVHGCDYRVTLVKGDIFFVVEREPPYVVGDGVSTIEKLIEKLNMGKGTESLSKLTIDTGMKETLAKEKLTPESVVEVGQKVHLRTMSNLSQGGTRREYTGSVHPDTETLLKKICKFLRLNYIGIDIICKDLSNPLTDGNGFIIELNSMPDLISSRAKGFLTRLYPNPADSFIPTDILILGENSSLSEAIRKKMKQDPTLGHMALAARNEKVLGAEIEELSREHKNMGFTWYRENTEVMMDTGLDKLCFITTLEEVVQFGLPVSYPSKVDIVGNIPKACPEVVKNWLNRLTNHQR